MFTSTPQASIVFLWLLIFCALSFNLGFCTSNILCNEKDQQALLIFKQGVVDPSQLLSSWSINQDCCQWDGVLCDNVTGRVTQLDLSCPFHDFFGSYYDKSKCLGGNVNLLFSELEFLDSLALSGNAFESVNFCPINGSTGPHNLSRTCGKFPNLVHLDLSYNNELALDNFLWISQLPSLNYLDLSGNIYLHMTPWIQLMTMLPSLSELVLRSCQLNNVNPPPEWYVNVTSIQILDLSQNNFDFELLKWVSNLSDSLTYLILDGNFLGHMPGTLLSLQNLRGLSLEYNQLNESIPNWIGQYKLLKYLDLSRNSLSGPIPTTLGNLSSLIYLDIRFNHLNGSLPESLGQLTSLVHMLVGGNSLAGNITEKNFAKLSNLQEIDFSSSSFHFNFNSDWIPPSQLKYINLSVANMGSTLPTWLYSFKYLHFLNMSSSGISSIDSDKLWRLAMKTYALDLSNNSIGGDLSNVLLNSTWIELGNNKFTGGLPRLSPNVIIFNIANNSFSGPTEPLLCHAMNGTNKLKYLDMSLNLLYGELPDCWESWKSLVYLNLESNNLTGSIPDSMGSLSALQSLHLAKNNFFGDVPVSMQNCRNLGLMDLGENQFSGNLPSWMDQSMKAIKLRSNKFTGSIPSEICQLTSLVILDLADNSLSGSIPNCLHNITTMVSANSLNEHEFDIFAGNSIFGIYSADTLLLLMKGAEASYSRNLKLVHLIDFSHNNLSGAIPLGVFSLTSLQSLNLSRNFLTGQIPEEIGRMTLLESLDLSINKLHGQIPESMSTLSFLNHLNLSFNNFSGKIPLGTQLQSFDALSYEGNPELCGDPLTKNCTEGDESDRKKPIEEDDDESEMLSWFYIGMGVGFATGFWGVCATIFMNRKFRHAYFKFLDDMKDRLYVFLVLKMKSLSV